MGNSDYDDPQDMVDHKATITVTCDAGYSTGTGTQYDMTCSDGTFDVGAPTCYGKSRCHRALKNLRSGCRVAIIIVKGRKQNVETSTRDLWQCRLF